MTLLFPIVSVEGSNFTEGLAQNQASAMNNLPGLPRGGPAQFLIRCISVITIQNFGPEFSFFSRAVGVTADPATDNFVSRWGFTASMGSQIAAAGLWRYYIDGLAIPYYDLDVINSTTPQTLHVKLQNTEATPKVAAAGGAMQATFWVELQQGY